MFDGTKDWCKIWRKTDSNFQKWHKFDSQISVYRGENSNFILENKMAELNQNENTRSTRYSVKTFFYLGNKWIAQLGKQNRWS